MSPWLESWGQERIPNIKTYRREISLLGYLLPGGFQGIGLEKRCNCGVS